MTAIYGLRDPETRAVRYVGKTVGSPRRRLTRHLAEARGGAKNHRCRWLRSLAAPPILDVFFSVPDRLAGAVERHVIAVMRSNGAQLTNTTDGGDGALGYRHSAAHREHMKQVMAGRTRSPEVRERMAAAQRGKRYSPEACARIAAGHTGLKYRPRTKPMSDEARARIAAGHVGIKHSEETKRKIADWHRGRKQSAATVEKRSISLRRAAAERKKRTTG